MITVSNVNGTTEQSNRWEHREPIFSDVPFEQSEWEGLYTVLKQVNQLKAELVRVHYEAVRNAYHGSGNAGLNLRGEPILGIGLA